MEQPDYTDLRRELSEIKQMLAEVLGRPGIAPPAEPPVIHGSFRDRVNQGLARRAELDKQAAERRARRNR